MTGYGALPFDTSGYSDNYVAYLKYFPFTGTRSISGFIGKVCDLLRSNTCSLLSTQLPKRRRSGNNGRYEKPAKPPKLVLTTHP